MYRNIKGFNLEAVDKSFQFHLFTYSSVVVIFIIVYFFLTREIELNSVSPMLENFGFHPLGSCSCWKCSAYQLGVQKYLTK